MTPEVQAKLDALLAYKSRALARDHAADIIRSLPKFSVEKREAEGWYATHLGWSTTQELQGKYNV